MLTSKRELSKFVTHQDEMTKDRKSNINSELDRSNKNIKRLFFTGQ